MRKTFCLHFRLRQTTSRSTPVGRSQRFPCLQSTIMKSWTLHLWLNFYVLSTFQLLDSGLPCMPLVRLHFFISAYFGIPAEWNFGVRAQHILWNTACSCACENLPLRLIFHSSSCMIFPMPITFLSFCFPEPFAALELKISYSGRPFWHTLSLPSTWCLLYLLFIWILLKWL